MTFGRDEDGAAAVEFALILPLFMVLISGLFDGARLINISMQVHAAAQAGAAWAEANGWDAGKVEAAVHNATPLGSSVAPAETMAPGCAVGQAIRAPTNGSCPGGVSPGQFATVSAQAAFTPLMPWPSVVWPKSVSAQAVVRVQ